MTQKENAIGSMIASANHAHHVAIRSTMIPGMIKLIASRSGFKPARITISSHQADGELAQMSSK